MANIDDLLKQLGSMNYSAPSSYKGYQSGYTPVRRTIPNLPKPSWDLNPEDFNSGKKKKDGKGLGINVWDMLSGTLGQPGGMITDAVYNQIEAYKNLGKKDNDKNIGQEIFDILIGSSPGTTIAKGIGAGAKKQWENWTDGDLSWGDIPGVGVLNGMDKHWKRGSDIMDDHAGVENKWGKFGGGLAIDIALDPLTYLTGGLSAAGKFGKAEEAAKILQHSKNLGITQKVKNVEEFKDVLIPALQNKYKNYPNLADRMVERKFDDIIKDIQTAKTKAFNDNVNKWGFSVPFSNKLTGMVGDIKPGNILHRTEATLGSQYKNIADDVLKKYGVDGAKAEKVLQTMFGKSDTGALTRSELEILDEALSESQKAFAKWDGNLKNLPDADIFDFKVLPRTSQGANAVRPMGNGAPQLTGPGQKLLTGTVDETVEQGDKWIRAVSPKTGNRNRGNKDIEDFVENQNVMFNGKTKFEHWLDKKNPFDARTLNTGDKFLDSMANVVADANSQRVGENAKYLKGLNDVSKFIKKNKVTESEMREAIYHLEGKAPKNLGDGWTASAKAQKLAEQIRKVTDAVGSDDIAAGNLGKLRENYFPHVLNKSDEDIQAMMDFDKSSGLNGLSNANKFDQSRKSFQTIADRDNYIQKLAKAISKETDAAKKADLQQQLDRVENLFDVDVVSALTRRVREGVRSRAMKKMQTDFKKFGMLKNAPSNGLQKLKPDELKKLGLQGEHYMHPKILEGMKRIDDIFTHEGMNKIARHMGALSDIWRPLVTNYKPSHYVNNFLGNAIQNTIVGVGLSDYKKAGKLITGWKKGKLTKEQMDLMHKAYSNNIISGGFIIDNMPTFNFDKPTWLENLAKKVNDNRVVNPMKQAGDFADDITRLANYLNGLNKYGSDKRAAQQVREYLFNYNELTNADRTMRVLVPFWNWTKNNLPRQVKLILEQPKYATNVERLKDFFNAEEEGADWQKETGIKVPGADRYMRIPSPTQDLAQLGDPGSFLGSMNPVLKGFLETQMNKKLYTNKPITYGQDDMAAEDYPGYIIDQTGIGKNIYDAATGEVPLNEALMKLFLTNTKINNGGGN